MDTLILIFLLFGIFDMIVLTIGVADVEMIRIVVHEGLWFSLDNRRLAVFKLLQCPRGDH